MVVPTWKTFMVIRHRLWIRLGEHLFLHGQKIGCIIIAADIAEINSKAVGIRNAQAAVTIKIIDIHILIYRRDIRS